MIYSLRNEPRINHDQCHPLLTGSDIQNKQKDLFMKMLSPNYCCLELLGNHNLINKHNAPLTNQFNKHSIDQSSNHNHNINGCLCFNHLNTYVAPRDQSNTLEVELISLSDSTKTAQYVLNTLCAYISRCLEVRSKYLDEPKKERKARPANRVNSMLLTITRN